MDEYFEHIELEDDDVIFIYIYDEENDKSRPIPVFRKNWKNIGNLFVDINSAYHIQNYAGRYDIHFRINCCTDSGSNLLKALRDHIKNLMVGDRCLNHRGSGMYQNTQVFHIKYRIFAKILDIFNFKIPGILKYSSISNIFQVSCKYLFSNRYFPKYSSICPKYSIYCKNTRYLVIKYSIFQ